jgi:hypothetical protein
MFISPFYFIYVIFICQRKNCAHNYINEKHAKMVQATKTAQLCDILAVATSCIHDKPSRICHIAGNEHCALEAVYHSFAAKTSYYVYQQ